MILPLMPPPHPSLGLGHCLVFPNRNTGALSPNVWIDLKGYIAASQPDPSSPVGTLSRAGAFIFLTLPIMSSISDSSPEGSVLSADYHLVFSLAVVSFISGISSGISPYLSDLSSQLLPSEWLYCHVLDLWVLFFFQPQQCLNFTAEIVFCPDAGSHLNLSRVRAICSFSGCD